MLCWPDAGLKVPYSKEILPTKERIMGKHIEDYAGLLKKEDSLFKKQFSGYLKNSKDPLNMTKNFEEAKNNIDKNTDK